MSTAVTPPVPVLWTITGVFLARVVGQALVMAGHGGVLPPAHEWYSGLVPYLLLLPAQVLILALMVAMNLGIRPGLGPLRRVTPESARVVRTLAWFYLAIMVVRYVATMSLHAERRWFGGTIPIFVHWLLAIELLLFARHHLHPSEAP